ncbi:MAG: hypothetical protein ACOX5Z_12220 [Desulfobulbus sp.]
MQDETPPPHADSVPAIDRWWKLRSVCIVAVLAIGWWLAYQAVEKCVHGQTVQKFFNAASPREDEGPVLPAYRIPACAGMTR